MEMEQKNQGTLGSIEDQFNLIAEEYDINRRKFITLALRCLFRERTFD